MARTTIPEHPPLLCPMGTPFLNLFFKERKCNGVPAIFTEFFTSLAMDNAIPHISAVFTMFFRHFGWYEKEPPEFP